MSLQDTLDRVQREIDDPGGMLFAVTADLRVMLDAHPELRPLYEACASGRRDRARSALGDVRREHTRKT